MDYFGDSISLILVLVALLSQLQAPLVRIHPVRIIRGVSLKTNISGGYSIETSAATGQNIALAVEMLLDMVMRRMDLAVEEAFGAGYRGRTVQLQVIDWDNNL